MDELFNAGFPETNTVGLPGIHGAGTTGEQGCGVKTPKAAAVAAATAGFVIEVHMPKVGRLAALLSIIDAIGNPEANTLVTDVTTSVQGAIPKLHWHKAPLHTAKAIKFPPFKIL